MVDKINTYSTSITQYSIIHAFINLYVIYNHKPFVYTVQFSFHGWIITIHFLLVHVRYITMEKPH